MNTTFLINGSHKDSQKGQVNLKEITGSGEISEQLKGLQRPSSNHESIPMDRRIRAAMLAIYNNASPKEIDGLDELVNRLSNDGDVITAMAGKNHEDAKHALKKFI